MLHCSWSLPFHTDEDYGESRYLPVTEATLTGLGYDPSWPGISSSYRQRILPCKQSLSIRLAGVHNQPGTRAPGGKLHRRFRCKAIGLDSPYYQTLEYFLDGSNTDSMLAQLAREIALHPDEYCSLTVRVKGYTQEKESQLQATLQQILASRKNTTLIPDFHGVGEIFADPLYQRIRERIDQEEGTQGMEEMLVAAFSQIHGEEK